MDPRGSGTVIFVLFMIQTKSSNHGFQVRDQLTCVCVCVCGVINRLFIIIIIFIEEAIKSWNTRNKSDKIKITNIT